MQAITTKTKGFKSHTFNLEPNSEIVFDPAKGTVTYTLKSGCARITKDIKHVVSIAEVTEISGFTFFNSDLDISKDVWLTIYSDPSGSVVSYTREIVSTGGSSLRIIKHLYEESEEYVLEAF